MKTKYLVFGITLMITMIISSYVFQFHNYGLSDDSSKWAEFGDFIGGTLNPILSLAAFVLLLKTISQNDEALKLNSRELELTRKELSDAAKAQIELTKINKQNQEKNKNSEREQRYLNKVDLIKSNLLHETYRRTLYNAEDLKPCSIHDIKNSIMNNTKIVIKVYPDTNLWTRLHDIVMSIMQLITTIQDEKPLVDHPDKDQIIYAEWLSHIINIKELIYTLSSLDHESPENSVEPYSNIEPRLTESITQLEMMLGFEQLS